MHYALYVWKLKKKKLLFYPKIYKLFVYVLIKQYMIMTY